MKDELDELLGKLEEAIAGYRGAMKVYEADKAVGMEVRNNRDMDAAESWCSLRDAAKDFSEKAQARKEADEAAFYKELLAD
ncbi:MAG: hypothetical protein LBR23_02260 [Spirochaetaceae bacterium]|jgi:hypothetical protein|nr:hypothetical protein [Spirochaetaceae bacterium]